MVSHRMTEPAAEMSLGDQLANLIVSARPRSAAQEADCWQDIREIIVEEAVDADALMELTEEEASAAWEVLQKMKNDPHDGREEYTFICLSLSLCPIHETDYAICFDDEDPECAQVRKIHPTHDT